MLLDFARLAESSGLKFKKMINRNPGTQLLFGRLCPRHRPQLGGTCVNHFCHEFLQLHQPGLIKVPASSWPSLWFPGGACSPKELHFRIVVWLDIYTAISEQQRAWLCPLTGRQEDSLSYRAYNHSCRGVKRWWEFLSATSARLHDSQI